MTTATTTRLPGIDTPGDPEPADHRPADLESTDLEPTDREPTDLEPAGRPAGLKPAELAARAQKVAEHPEEWLQRVRLSPDGRWYERVHIDDEHEVWLIGWLPGQSTGFHDHGGASGAFTVVLGGLEEHGLSAGRALASGDSRQFGPGYVHDVRNTSAAPAVSVHVYSPPLATMRRYDLDADGRLVELETETAENW